MSIDVFRALAMLCGRLGVLYILQPFVLWAHCFLHNATNPLSLSIKTSCINMAFVAFSDMIFWGSSIDGHASLFGVA